MSKQLKLGMELPEREDLAEARANIKLLREQAAERGWKLTSRYRKKQRKFYFNVIIPRDEIANNYCPSDIPRNFLRQYFPEAYLTSGGFGFGGDADFTFAERGDRDQLDRPIPDVRTTERGW